MVIFWFGIRIIYFIPYRWSGLTRRKKTIMWFYQDSSVVIFFLSWRCYRTSLDVRSGGLHDFDTFIIFFSFIFFLLGRESERCRERGTERGQEQPKTGPFFVSKNRGNERGGNGKNTWQVIFMLDSAVKLKWHTLPRFLSTKSLFDFIYILLC